MRSWAFIIPAVLFVSLPTEARQSGWSTSIVFRGSYTSSAKVFVNPDAPSDQLRRQYLPIQDLLGAGAELRMFIPEENIFLTISYDYITRTQDDPQFIFIGSSAQRVPSSEGLSFFPLEIGLHTYIPVGSENYRMTMGGGIGRYAAVRHLSVLGVGSEVVNSPVSYGIHVNTGFEYRLNGTVSFRAELKFRDPEVVNENRFDKIATIYNGSPVTFLQDSFRSRIQVNGLSFSVGVMVDFF